MGKTEFGSIAKNRTNIVSSVRNKLQRLQFQGQLLCRVAAVRENCLENEIFFQIMEKSGKGKVRKDLESQGI